MTVHFIGAGPGAADLITVRGRDLLGALPGLPLCRLDRAGRTAAVLPARRAQGRHRADVARRDRARICRRPSCRAGCGAAAFRRPLGVERRRRAGETAGAPGIPYTLTPGVPSFAAAAAALGRELTIPAVAQSLVLTRVSGRASEMPPERDAGRFRQDRRDAGNPSRHPRAAADRRRTDAALWRRLPGRHRRAGLLARRAHRARHAGDHRG